MPNSLSKTDFVKEHTDSTRKSDEEMHCAAEQVKTIYSKDVTILLLPNPGANRDILVMEVTLKYTKN